MLRQETKLRLDRRVYKALMTEAQQRHLSFNGYVETLLFQHIQTLGYLPIDAERLPDRRGGHNRKVDPQIEDAEKPT